MKKLNKIFIASYLAMIPVTILARPQNEDLKQCIPVIEACDEVIKAQESQTEALNALIKTQESQSRALENKVISLQNPPWYSDYKITFLLGIFGGAVLMDKLNR